MKQKKLNILNNIILVFLLIQPMLDIYMAVVGEKLDLFGISIATLTRTVSITALFIFVVVYQIKNKIHIKLIYLIIGYVAVVAIYTYLHHLNIVSSGGYYITENIYNPITELLYVERLIVPVIFMYSIIITKPSIQKTEKTLVCVSVIISFVIIITNLFKVSYASYSVTPGTDTVIKYNLIDWFVKEGIPYKESLSKGFFVSANQIGALLVVLLPLIIYNLVKRNKPYMYLLLLLQIIAMTLIGTRVASLGWILVCFAMIGIYVILKLANKLQPLKTLAIVSFVVILEIGTLLFLKSPARKRDFAQSYEGMYDEEIGEKLESGEYISLETFNEMLQDGEILKSYVGENTTDKGLEHDAMVKYIYETYKYHYITEKYVKDIYPYDDDPKFWLNIFEAPISVKGDNRARQVEIVKRIKHNNKNYIFDTLVGMGATPMNSRGYMIENDIISHYYNLGIVGTIIFIAPFVSCVIYVIVRMRKNILGLLNYRFLGYSLSLCMAYFVGFFAGHVLDEYIVTIFIATIAASIYNMYSCHKLEEVKDETT